MVPLEVKVPGDFERAANKVDKINKKIEERKLLDESWKNSIKKEVPGDLVIKVEEVNKKIQDRKLRKTNILDDVAVKVEKINKKIEGRNPWDDYESSVTLNKSTDSKSSDSKKSKE